MFIHKIINSKEYKDIDAKNELLNFSIELSVRKMKFTANSFFSLDRNVICIVSFSFFFTFHFNYL